MKKYVVFNNNNNNNINELEKMKIYKISYLFVQLF